MADEQDNLTKQSSNTSDPAENMTDLEKLVEELKLKNVELLDNWKRTTADFENFKRRTATEKRELLEYSKEMTVLRLMPSLQSMEQVLVHAPQDEKYKDWLTGLRATITQFEKTLEELGVVKIKTVGEQFDPERHEAVEQVKGEEPGKIVKEIQPGYLLNKKVIIPAKVGVGEAKN